MSSHIFKTVFVQLCAQNHLQPVYFSSQVQNQLLFLMVAPWRGHRKEEVRLAYSVQSDLFITYCNIS